MQDVKERLLDKGFAYKRKSGVYFEIEAFSPYGKLSGNTLKKLQAGIRVPKRREKKSPFDFALWIHNDKHLMQWDSPWGKGYPGWHIECSAMAIKYLGKEIDIHTGGEDNIFPHHESEIAQSFGAHDRPLAVYWLHSRHLFIDGEKMSKSLGNYYTLSDLIKKGFRAREIRFFLLSTHYRKKNNLTEKGLSVAQESLRTLDTLITNLHAARGKKNTKIPGIIKSGKKAFVQAMDDDLNISLALASLFEVATKVNSQLEKGMSRKDADGIIDFFEGIDEVLGLNLGKQTAKWQKIKEAEEDVKVLLEKREEARKGKNWDKADELRTRLKAMGILLEDTKSGPRWRKAA